MKYLIIFISKIIYLFCKVFKIKCNLPGRIALKIDNNILKKINLPDNIIIITGSNGKTSVIKMIYEILSNSNFKVFYNIDSSLQMEDIVSVILNKTSLLGNVNEDILIFEIDESYICEFLRYIKPKYLVITNIYQNQMTKRGYPQLICDEISNAITQDINLILNADDPASAMCEYNGKKTIYFGISENVFYNNSNKKMEYMITDLDLKKGEMVINRKHTIHMTNKINYNAYNMVTAYAIAKEFGIDEKKIVRILTNYDLNNDLIRHLDFDGYEIMLINVKESNPISYNQAVMYVINQKEECTVILTVNEIDSANTINDTSWIWDTNFELLKSDNIKRIILLGNYANDIAIRLENSEIGMDKVIINNSNEIIKEIKEKCVGKIYVLISIFDEAKLFKGR